MDTDISTMTAKEVADLSNKFKEQIKEILLPVLRGWVFRKVYSRVEQGYGDVSIRILEMITNSFDPLPRELIDNKVTGQILLDTFEELIPELKRSGYKVEGPAPGDPHYTYTIVWRY